MIQCKVSMCNAISAPSIAATQHILIVLKHSFKKVEPGEEALLRKQLRCHFRLLDLRCVALLGCFGVEAHPGFRYEIHCIEGHRLGPAMLGCSGGGIPQLLSDEGHACSDLVNAYHLPILWMVMDDRGEEDRPVLLVALLLVLVIAQSLYNIQ